MSAVKPKPVTCDCLNDCGDDPWLKDGSSRAQPCDNMLARQEHERSMAQQLAMVSRLREAYGAGNLFELIEKIHAAVAARDADVANFRTVMMAAAVEITAHCDKEGYGPANLVHRLERGYPEQYGYDAQTVVRMEQRVTALEAGLDQARRELQIAYLGRSHEAHNAALDRIMAALETEP